jgi:hypothetical protein
MQDRGNVKFERFVDEEEDHDEDQKIPKRTFSEKGFRWFVRTTSK